MFDDLIDHSYDQIKDPLDRLCAVIDLNKNLLTDTDLVKSLWQKNQNRFLKNVAFARTNLYNIIEQQANNDFDKIKWHL